jgi:hypothetical protein
MRLVSIDSSVAEAALPALSVVCHDVRHPQRRTSVLVRKGTQVDRAQLLEVLRRVNSEEPSEPIELGDSFVVHLAVPDEGDIPEDEAAVRLATAVAGAGVHVGESHNGQVTLTSATRGMLCVDAALLDRVNSHAGVLVLTSLPDVAADDNTPLGVVKCAPLFLSAGVLKAVEDIRAEFGPILQLQNFRQHRVAFVAPSGRVRGSAFQQSTGSLARALEWYGSSLAPTIATETTTSSLAEAFRTALASGADLILAAGAAATDPADIVFDGLRRAGGEVDQIGIPAEPGTACWIGRLEGRPVLGLASCELFGQPGALDLLLPRLLVGEALDRGLLQRIALGGLLVGGPSRVAPYHAAGQ